MNEPLSFEDIISRYRSAGPESEDKRRMEELFSENTREWAAAMITMHSGEYGISPENRNLLWETVKKANLEILETLEIEMSQLSSFAEYYLEYIHQELLISYFNSNPRLAEVIRKNVKWSFFKTEIVDQVRDGEIRNAADRKIKSDGYNPPLFDSWTRALENNYPGTFKFIMSLASEPPSPENAGGGDILAACEAAAEPGNMDVMIRKELWKDVEHELEEAINGDDWNYNRVPFKSPSIVTNFFFRVTINWFIVNNLLQSQEYGEETEETIASLEAVERANIGMGNIGKETVAPLMESFRSHGPSDFFKEANVGLEGVSSGVLFDKIANYIYNRLLFPELARVAGDDWGLER